MADLRTIHVFMASPGDLAVERRAFKGVIEELNKGFGDGAGVKFVALGWEDTLATTGRRSQGAINLDVDRCDVFVLALYSRWGQEAPDAKPYTSYTEEEFHRALNRWKNTGVPEVFVFFKHITPREMSDPGPQLVKVLAFRKSLEDSRLVIYRGFAEDNDFRDEVDRHLRAYAKGELVRADAPRETVVLPLQYIQEVELAKAEARHAAERAEREQKSGEAASARADQLALELAERAAKAALDGRIEEATQTFAIAQQATSNPQVLYLAAEFYNRTGDAVSSEQALTQLLAIGGRDAITLPTAKALILLGFIYFERGALDRAEKTSTEALAIAEKLEDEETIVIAYCNLGTICKERGELDQSEKLYAKALAIAERLGNQDRLGSVFLDLGNLATDRGKDDRAEEMYTKAWGIYRKLRDQAGIALAVGSLANLHVSRGQLDQAEKMYKKALANFTKLGKQEEMAATYGNLAVIYKGRGEVDRSEKLILKSLAIFEKLGSPYLIARQYQALGSVYKERGDMDRAENMSREALAIFERLGIKLSIAEECWNLGLIHADRVNMAMARELVTKARDLFASLGRQEHVANAEMWMRVHDDDQPS